MENDLECSFKKEFLQNTTILYVESDKKTRTEAFEIFDGFLSKVIVAVDGIDAFEKFVEFQNEIDVILTDIELDRMNGLDLLRKIKKLIGKYQF